ncbi:hypothetical protein PO124_24320 [Bacillus licheniformis]|nr:hypothetical protein [Bacillus licheniformis]
MPIQTFEYRGLPYTYMCSEFSTKQINRLLDAGFTKTPLKRLGKYNIISYKGKWPCLSAMGTTS